MVLVCLWLSALLILHIHLLVTLYNMELGASCELPVFSVAFFPITLPCLNPQLWALSFSSDPCEIHLLLETHPSPWALFPSQTVMVPPSPFMDISLASILSWLTVLQLLGESFSLITQDGVLALSAIL